MVAFTCKRAKLVYLIPLISCKTHLRNVNTGVVVDLRLFHHNVVLAVTDVRDVPLAEVPCLDSAHANILNHIFEPRIESILRSSEIF